MPIRRFALPGVALGALALLALPSLPPARSLLAPVVLAQGGPNEVRVWEATLPLPTYEEGLPDQNPPFDLLKPARFNYPYTLRYGQTSKRASRLWRTLNLENEYLRCTVLPDLGGHIYSCVDKLNDAQMFYANPSIKFAQIAYRGAWTALGVEFNFPVSHNWMTASPVDFALSRRPDGSASVWVGNIDRAYGMQWRVELTLHPGRALLEQKTTLYNRGDVRQRFYWWANAGVQVWDDSRVLYPMSFTAAHGFADIDTWPVTRAGVDLSIVGNHVSGPVSRFAHGSREPFMAIYHPRTKAGVVHYSAPDQLPTKKIFSWGSNADGLDWRRALSDDNSAYVEVQAGLFRDQETYGFLEPQESITFTEYWIPFRETDGLTRATPEAVLKLERKPGKGGDSIEARLNATRAFPGAILTVEQGGKALASETVSLGPEETLTRVWTGVAAGSPCTFTLKDRSGALLVRHTEGQFDWTPAAEVKTGPQPPRAVPPAASRTEGDWLALGTDQELNGRKLDALGTYQGGLERYPDSVDLARAAGRLEVSLKRFGAAAPHLERVLERTSQDREAAYYLGLADAGLANTRGAQIAFETSQLYGLHRPAATFALAGAAARAGNRQEALRLLERMTDESPLAVRGGAIRVALLRNANRVDDARRQLMQWLSEDPTSSFLKVEAARLGLPSDEVWPHLAADPERILEIVADDIRFGLYQDALDLLGREYPTRGVVTEPGMPRPEAYPLIAYYRGFVRHMMGQPARPDFDEASKQPTTYVFPNRADTLPVLREAIRQNPNDATAHFLLGSLLASGGQVTEAMASWETARTLNPQIPTLHRNMGYALLSSSGSTDLAVAILQEGTKYDPLNVGVYLGLEQAMSLAGRPAADRARAILAYPDQPNLPALLVYKLSSALAESDRFDEAEKLFAGRFFPREEGGVNVRGIWVRVRLLRAASLAEQKQCARARTIVDGIGREAPGMAFTRDGLGPFIKAAPAQELLSRVLAACPAR